MANDVKVDFTADISQLKRAATEIKSEIKSIASTPIPTNAFAELDKSFANLERYALSVRGTLRTIERSTVGVAGLDGLGQAAKRSIQDVTVLYNRIQAIQVEMGQTRDPIALSRLAKEAREAGVALDTLNTKIQRVAAGRAAAEQRVRASALDPTKAFSRGQLGRQVVNAADPRLGMAAELGETLSNTGLVSGAGLAAGGAVAAVGFAAVKVSEKLRDQAEKRLAAEEKLQAVYNEQARTMQSIASVNDLRGKSLDPYKMSPAQFAAAQMIQQRQKQGFGYGEGGAQTLDQYLAPERALRSYSDQIAKAAGNAAELQRILSELQKGVNRDLTGSDRDELTRKVSFMIDDRKRSATGFTADESAQFKAEQEAFREKQKMLIADLKAAQAAVKDLHKGFDATFKSVVESVHSDNPFVSLYSKGEEALKAFRLQTAGLSKDLVDQGLELLKTQQHLEQFTLRVSGAYESRDLREQARGLRFGTSEEDRQAREQQRTSALAKFNRRISQEESEDLFRNPFFTEQTRKLLSKADEDTSTQERIDRELRFAKGFKPSNDSERAVIDSKLIGLSKGVDPSELRQDQRNAIAAALERQAERVERREVEAFQVQKDIRGYQKAIAEGMGAFLKASTGGTKGLEAFIKIQNDTAAETAVREALRSPTPEDTNRTYSLGTAGGSGGLTSF